MADGDNSRGTLPTQGSQVKVTEDEDESAKWEFPSPEYPMEDSRDLPLTEPNKSLEDSEKGVKQDEDREDARKVGEAMVDEVISLAEKADELKEHDVLDEENEQATSIEEELKKEKEANGGWVQVLGNDELMMKCLVDGERGMRPMRGDVCHIIIEGRLAQDESVVFEEKQEMEVTLGDAEVIAGIDLSMPLMKKGETVQLKVGPRFAYGTRGLAPLVPPNAPLVYEIQLISFEAEKDLEELSVAERREIGNRKRERGNWWYGRGESSLAVQSYRRALEFLDEVEGGVQVNTHDPSKPKTEKITPELRALFEDRLKTLNNMAAAQLKLQAYEPALISVDSVLKCQPDNVKALFRKGKILGEKGETEKAIKVLNQARSIDPEEKSISLEITRLEARRKKEEKKEKVLYSRMFGAKERFEKSQEKKGDESEASSANLKSALSYGLVLGGVAIAAAGVMAYRADVGEGREPDEELKATINLDLSEMEREWRRFQTQTYILLNRNCSDVVGRVLEAGNQDFLLLTEAIPRSRNPQSNWTHKDWVIYIRFKLFEFRTKGLFG